MSKRGINRLQNLLLVVLFITAVFLLSRIPQLNGDWANQFQAFLAHTVDVPESQSTNQIGRASCRERV